MLAVPKAEWSFVQCKQQKILESPLNKVENTLKPSKTTLRPPWHETTSKSPLKPSNLHPAYLFSVKTVSKSKKNNPQTWNKTSKSNRFHPENPAPPACTATRAPSAASEAPRPPKGRRRRERPNFSEGRLGKEPPPAAESEWKKNNRSVYQSVLVASLGMRKPPDVFCLWCEWCKGGWVKGGLGRPKQNLGSWGTNTCTWDD